MRALWAFLALALTLLAGPARAACSVDDDPSPLLVRIVGSSSNGQWYVSYDMRQDAGGFTGTEGATIIRSFCVLIGPPRSIGTIGAVVQKVRVAPDRKAAFDAAWAQYVTLPFSDPKLAAVVADYRAAVCPLLLPYRPQPCL